ncbi:MAG: FliM/FliN family flagellar motor switch protein [Proteobacteria bacterium]|uniref:FliM/FliN family flagellar motor switch protein n=1 Tax=Candidatus Avisuccinivibrio stercorigallinarum TaxID=2840704 RepID=A0A9D9DAT8_9GAMM|nr:FliM/FliN family flagellar motor switch protein [Candidatus Avisuccinivibrio stercorigallinarum]
MQFENLSRIQLHNILLRLHDESFKPSAFDFKEDKTPAPALKISAGTLTFYLQPLDFACLKSLPAFNKEELKPGELEVNLKLAGLEILLLEPLEKLSALCGCDIAVAGYEPEYTPAAAEDNAQNSAVSFEYRLGAMAVPMVLYCSADGIEFLCEKLQPLAEKRIETKADPDPAMTVHCAAGRFSLTARELKTLRPGDAAVLTEYYLKQEELSLECGTLCSRAQVQGSGLVLKQPFQHNESIPMADEKSKDLTAADDLQLDCVLELDRLSMSLSELKALQEGSVLPLNNRDLTQVKMLINGQCTAEGRIIEAGDCFAFQITRLPKDD